LRHRDRVGFFHYCRLANEVFSNPIIAGDPSAPIFVREGVVIMSLLWVLCFPVAAIMAAAVAEWAVGRRTTGVAPMPPGRVISFNAARRRTVQAWYRAAAPEFVGPAQVIVLREARQRRTNLINQSGLRASR
jgi:hypothetical protein